MKPAIDQMIAYLEGEMAKYPHPGSYLDKGYRVLEQSHRQAEKIKARTTPDKPVIEPGCSPTVY